MNDDTIFDKIIRKEIPAEIVYEDEWALAFKDVSPQAPVHTLVIPKKKCARFSDLSRLDAEDVGEFVKRVAMVARECGVEEGGYRIVFNCGQHGQQTVEYLHAHILGGRPMSWPPG